MKELDQTGYFIEEWIYQKVKAMYFEKCVYPSRLIY